MNRYATFAVLALAAFALSTINSAPTVDNSLNEDEEAAQFSLQTTDDDEVAQVRGLKLDPFEGFCTKSRDNILADIREKTGQVSSQGFSSLFTMIGDVASTAMETSQEANERLTKQLADPSSPVDGEDMIADTQRSVSQQGQPRAFITAVTGTVSATMDAVGSVVGAKIAQLRRQSDPTQFFGLLSGGCAQAANYKSELEEQFVEYKKQLPSNIAARFDAITMQSVPCLTSSRIVRVNAICVMLSNIIEPAKELFAGVLSRKAIAEATAEQ